MQGDHFLRIADLTIALRCDETAPAWEWDLPSSRFLVSPSVADVELTIRTGTPADSTGDLLFESGSVWRLFHDQGSYRIECRAPMMGEQPYKAATFDETFTRGEICVAPVAASLNTSPFDFPIDEVLMTNLLGRGRGAELHSCGVIDQDGRGYIFAGVSGAGKTTTARLWESSAASIVSDDRVIVRERDGKMWMYGTPWHGEAELAAPEGAPLSAIYLLEQSTSNEVRTVPPAEVVARLFRCTFPPFYDPASVDFILQFLERIGAAVPVRELAFTRDTSVIDVVRRARP